MKIALAQLLTRHEVQLIHDYLDTTVQNPPFMPKEPNEDGVYVSKFTISEYLERCVKPALPIWRYYRVKILYNFFRWI